MRKISEDFFKEAYEELSPEDNIETSVIDKTAFDVSIDPSSLIGAITGAVVASKKAKADILKKQMEQDNTKSLSGNYYSQTQNIANGMRIIFTPFGVTYMVKHQGREVSLQTIETHSMNEEMYTAWQGRNENYFKHLMLNKMHSDISMVEQHFAKNFIQNQLGMQNQLSKKASEEVEDVQEYTDLEVLEHIASIKEFYGKRTPLTEKLAGVMCDILDDGTEFKIAWGLEQPYEKYAGLSDSLSFLGLTSSSTDIKKFTNPNYLATRVKVGFMPDRVVFTVDNNVVSTLLAMHMDHDAFERFEKQDKNYFVDVFKNEAQRGLQRMKGQQPPNIPLMQKKASYDGISQIFERGDIHPVVYFLVLTRQYTAQWMTWECEALVKVLETDFNLTDGIKDIPLNKILSVQAANRSDAIYTQHHAFEKIVRSFNDKPVDFLERQIDDITMEEIAFALDVLAQVTPHEDIYINFSQNVFNHLVHILTVDENKVYYPTAITGTPGEGKFVQEVNMELIDTNNEFDLEDVHDRVISSKTIQENELIAHIGLDILLKLKGFKEHHTTIDDEKFIEVILDKVKIPLEQHVKSIIKKQVLKNIEMDETLREKKLLLKKQINEFAL